MIEKFKKNITNLLIRRSHTWQKESELRKLELWGAESNSLGHLSVAGLDMLDLLESYGAPLLVVNKNKLQLDANDILQAMSQAPAGSKALYSYKTNCIPGILKEIHQMGLGAEVISPYELWLAEQLNVPGDMIVYNGVNKTEDSLRRAIKLNVLAINIDHIEEVERIDHLAQEMGAKVNVGIRLGMSNRSQFGLNIESGEAFAVSKKIQSCSDHLNFHCVHFNVTSNAKHSYTHKNHALHALTFVSKLYKELGIEIPYLDIGGGFGVPTTKNMTGVEYGLYRTFGCLPKPPSLADFQSIDEFVKDVVDAIIGFCKTNDLMIPSILVEPGRFITSRSEFLLAKVHAIKKKLDGTEFAITDVGRLSMTFPCEFEYHEIFVANKLREHPVKNYQLMGRICTSADWLAKNRYLPELKPNDVLAIMDAGAYFSSNSSNFAFPRPTIVMIENGQPEIIRNPETFEHLVALDAY